jgi:hypothetical protein
MFVGIGTGAGGRPTMFCARAGDDTAMTATTKTTANAWQSLALNPVSLARDGRDEPRMNANPKNGASARQKAKMPMGQ